MQQAGTRITPKYSQTLRDFCGLKTVAMDTSIPERMKYSDVILERSDSRMLVMGTVVTHLSLQDWCEMNGYTLFSIDGAVLPALAEERTELG